MFNFFNRKSASTSQTTAATRPVELVEMPKAEVKPVEGPGGLPKEEECLTCHTCGAPNPVGTEECLTCGNTLVEKTPEPTVVDLMVEARDAIQVEIEETAESEVQADDDAALLETLTLEVVGLNNHLIDVKERAQKALSRKTQAEADAKALLGMLGKGKKIEYLTPAQRVEKAEAEKAKAEKARKAAEEKAKAEAKRLEAEEEAKAEAARLEAVEKILQWCASVEAKESEAAELRRRITQPYFYN